MSHGPTGRRGGPYFACDDEDWDGTYNTCQFYWNDDEEVDPGNWIVFELRSPNDRHPMMHVMSDAEFRKDIEWVD